MIRTARNWLVFGLLIILPSLVVAQEQNDSGRLQVAIKEAAPFAWKDEQGRWQGLAVHLWRRTADEAGISWRWQEHDSLGSLIQAVETGRADIAVGALTMTPEREARFDFSHPYYHTGLAIVTQNTPTGFFARLKPLVSWEFLSAVGVLLGLLLAVGFLLWLIEHKRNPEQFGGRSWRGVGEGFWWSAVTMTTVGYGDKAPVTALGRGVATVWMFVSVITISGFTATIASSIALNEVKGLVSAASDLEKADVVTVEGSTAQRWLEARGITSRALADIDTGLQLLRTGKAQAMVYDAPLIQHRMQTQGIDDLELLPERLEKQHYAFGLKDGFEQRDVLNQALLSVLRTPEWDVSVKRMLGSQ